MEGPTMYEPRQTLQVQSPHESWDLKSIIPANVVRVRYTPQGEEEVAQLEALRKQDYARLLSISNE